MEIATKKDTTLLNIKNIGKYLKHERLRKALTIKDVAEKINKNLSFVQKIENGESLLSVETLTDICNILDIPPDYIMQEVYPDFLIYAIDDYIAKIDIDKNKATFSALSDFLSNI